MNVTAPNLQLVGPTKSSSAFIYEKIKDEDGSSSRNRYRVAAFYVGDKAVLYEIIFDTDENFEETRKIIEKGLSNPNLLCAHATEFRECYKFLYRVQIDRRISK